MIRYMMATKAIHNLGDISREKPSLCFITGEDEKNYIGNWVEGMGFTNVKFPKDSTRELTYDEKKKYNGFRVGIGNDVIGVVETEETVYAGNEESPIIILPKNDLLIQQLRFKLEEYQKRYNPYHAPELQMDTICKIQVLERLLRDGSVNTYELSKELYDIYGSSLNGNSFNSACAVINDYCVTGGKQTNGGTGLSASLPA